MTARNILMSAAGNGGPSGYYYYLTPSAAYYAKRFQGIQPLSSGWMISGNNYIGTTVKYFVLTLNAVGQVLNYREDSSYGYSNIGGMHLGGSKVLSGDVVPMSQGINTLIGCVNSTPAYTNTPSQVFPSYASPNLQCVDVSTSTSFSSSQYNYDPEYGGTYYYYGASNAVNGTVNWVKRIDSGPWSYPFAATMRANDATNVWFSVQNNNASYGGLLAFNKTTGVISSAFTMTGQPCGISAFSDESGNLYLGSYNGDLTKISTSNTVLWSKRYFDQSTSQNYGYMQACFYDNAIYVVAGNHPNGVYLSKISPSDGSVIWSVKFPALYSTSSISVSQNGIMFAAIDNNGSGLEKSFLINYPLVGGIFGTFGILTLSTMTTAVIDHSVTIQTASGPNLTSLSGSTTTYQSSLGTATNPLSTKVTI